ncbi:hypothetical protein QYF61_025328 [Mycteria americana]|uniref:Uncharacterized protein n=1 Tax=Mycteria americana TaxID=33587 RepID=A0AAN7SG30_MYCAM|nr:hypothetical protein QYF61_025328 [Mycteria americana]
MDITMKEMRIPVYWLLICWHGFAGGYLEVVLHEKEEDSSHSSPAPVWGPSHRRQFSTNFSNVSPSHGLQFFMNCSSVGPFHGVQSFRNRLLQHRSPTGSQVLPANLLQHGLLSPWVHRSCQEPAPAQASHGVTASFRHPSALVWGPPRAAAILRKANYFPQPMIRSTATILRSFNPDLSYSWKVRSQGGKGRLGQPEDSQQTRLLSGVKKRNPFKEDVICHPGKWTTMERGIQYLTEFAVLEVIYGDLNNKQLSKDPDEVKCT